MAETKSNITTQPATSSTPEVGPVTTAAEQPQPAIPGVMSTPVDPDYAEFQKWKAAQAAAPKKEPPKALSLEDAYGKDYVKIVKVTKDHNSGQDITHRTIMTAQAWKNWTTPDKDGSKDGWRKDVKVPPEFNNPNA